MVNIDQSQLDVLNAGKNLAQVKKPKKNKYSAEKTTSDGKVFDSKKEAARYVELKFQEHCGLISNLETQPKYILQEGFKYNGKKKAAITFKLDFRYEKDGELIVEDVKGGNATITEAYSIRRRLLLKKFPEINFIET